MADGGGWLARLGDWLQSPHWRRYEEQKGEDCEEPRDAGSISINGSFYIHIQKVCAHTNTHVHIYTLALSVCSEGLETTPVAVSTQSTPPWFLSAVCHWRGPGLRGEMLHLGLWTSPQC